MFVILTLDSGHKTAMIPQNGQKCEFLYTKKGAEAPLNYRVNFATVGAITKQKPNAAIPIIMQTQMIGNLKSRWTSFSFSLISPY